MSTKSNKLVLTTQDSSTTTSSPPMHNPFTINLKIMAIFAAVLIFVLVIVRLFLVLTKSSRSSNTRLSNHRLNLVQPQVSIIGQNHFKPDLPPAYTEAVTNIDIDESKLPSYDELHNQQTSTTT